MSPPNQGKVYRPQDNGERAFFLGLGALALFLLALIAAATTYRRSLPPKDTHDANHGPSDSTPQH